METRHTSAKFFVRASLNRVTNSSRAGTCKAALRTVGDAMMEEWMKQCSCSLSLARDCLWLCG